MSFNITIDSMISFLNRNNIVHDKNNNNDIVYKAWNVLFNEKNNKLNRIKTLEIKLKSSTDNSNFYFIESNKNYDINKRLTDKLNESNDTLNKLRDEIDKLHIERRKRRLDDICKIDTLYRNKITRLNKTNSTSSSISTSSTNTNTNIQTLDNEVEIVNRNDSFNEDELRKKLEKINK